MENTHEKGNGGGRQPQSQQPFCRITIEVRGSPGDAVGGLQEKLRQGANDALDFIRRWVDIRIEARVKESPSKAERITIE